MVKKKKMKLGTKIAIGFGVVAAGLGALLYYLSTRARGEEIVVGKTYYFDYIPGLINQRYFIIGKNTPFGSASEFVTLVEGGTGTGTNTKIDTVWKYDTVTRSTVSFAYNPKIGRWTGLDFSLAVGDYFIVGYVTSFELTL